MLNALTRTIRRRVQKARLAAAQWLAPAMALSYALTGNGPRRSGVLPEPPVRSFIEWTPAALKQAQVQADAGNLRLAALICESILGDDRAPAVLSTRVNALLGSELTFDPSGDGRRKGRALKALEAEEDWWTLFPEEETGKLLTWGRLLGIGLGELVDPPAIVAEARYVPTLKVWHPSALRWDWKTRGWFLRLEGGTEIPISPGDGKWILYTPYGASRPWAHGLWRGMSRLYLLKLYATQDWALHSEVHGNPIRVGFAPESVDPALRKELAADLRDLGRDTAMALPPGFDFKLVEATAKTWEMFQAQIELANRSMSVQAIGTNLPTDVTAGVGTGATAQTLVRIDYKRADGQTLATTLRTQGLTWWATWNFGNADLAPWPKWNVEPPEDKSHIATTWKTVGDSLVAFQKAGFVVEAKDVEEKFGIPLKAAPAPLPAPTPPTDGQQPKYEPAPEA